MARARRGGLLRTIGRAAKATSCESEGDPVAILTTMLAAFGNAAGNGPHVRIGAQRHPARIFPCHVGITARGRKGQAFSDGIALIRLADPAWYDEAFTSGLGSGEGLLEKLARIQKARKPLLVCARALVYEPEFARLSAVAERNGSTLSPILRDSFDRDRMEIATRQNAIVVDRAHVTIVAQSTPDSSSAASRPRNSPTASQTASCSLQSSGRSLPLAARCKTIK